MGTQPVLSLRRSVRLGATVTGLALLIAAQQPHVRAQSSAPGGVAAGLIAWQKADVSGATNTSWPDASGSGNTAGGGLTLLGGSHARAINFNPTYDIVAGTWMQYAGALGVSGTNSFSTLVVLRRDDSRLEIYFGSNQGNPTFTAHVTPTGAYGGGTSGSGGNGTCGFQTTTTMPVLVPGIGSHVRTSTTITGQLNGGGAVSVPCTESYAASPRMVGRRNLTNQNAYYFDGVVSELIQFGRALTASEVRLVQSYLAIKYGITLDQTTPSDYLDSTARSSGMPMRTSPIATTSRASAATTRAA